MRFPGIYSVLLLFVGTGCACGPNYYGPGLGGNPYNTCIGNNAIAPPVAMGVQSKHHRPTLSERKQARELKRWYRELNDEPSQRHESGDYCPECQRKHRNRHRSGFNSNPYDEWSYNNGMSMNEMVYDGQIIDGATYGGDYASDGYCPDCQSEHAGQPTYVNPTPVPSAPPSEPVAPAPPSEPNALSTPADEYYSPPTLLTPTTSTVNPVRQVSIPPVEQMLYAPPVQE